MCEILNKFTICENISDVMKQSIKRFHVFDDNVGLNILFITDNDQVFGMGSNDWGCLGLGHDSAVDEPLRVMELCAQNIRQFFIGKGFVLALSDERHLYGMGFNEFGQLGRGYETVVYQKAARIKFAGTGSATIAQVCCGSAHSLALTTDNRLFGWGLNQFGQTGCGVSGRRCVTAPARVTELSDYRIKEIRCSYQQSFALSAGGLVFSWGDNSFGQLGHSGDDDKYFVPKVIDISNVRTVCPSDVNTYFLTADGVFMCYYFCGHYKNRDRSVACERRPRRVPSVAMFESVRAMAEYQRNNTSVTALSQNTVYEFVYNKCHKTRHKSYFDYYCDVYHMTEKTIDLDQIQ